MAEEKEIILRNEELNEVLSSTPKWILRWGVSVIALLLLITLTLSYFIQYNDTISAKITISSINPPVILTAKTNENISNLLVNDNDKVFANQVIAVIENSSNYNDVLCLDSLLEVFLSRKRIIFNENNLNILSSLEVGELTHVYLNFLKSFNIYFHQKKEIEIELNEDLFYMIKELKYEINNWKEKYLIHSPINGEISYLNAHNKNLHIEQGDYLFAIIPNEKGKIIGKCILPVSNIGKLIVGQNCNIKLNNYPYTQYGIITGYVVNISKVPNKDGYIVVNIDLNHGLKTSYNINLPYQVFMEGDVEIITQKLSVMDRIFFNFKKLTNH